MKWMECRAAQQYPDWSLPVRGAWIEMMSAYSLSLKRVSLPVRGAWIEIPTGMSCLPAQRSLPVRGAWIEIPA